MGEVVGGGLEDEPLVGEDRREVLKEGPALGGVRVEAVDGFDLEQAVVLLVVARGANLPGDVVAGAEGETPQVGLRDVDIVRAGEEGIAPEEAVVAVVGDLQETAREEVAVALGLGLEEVEDEVALAQGGGIADAKVAGDANQLAASGALKLGDVERGEVERGDALLQIGDDGSLFGWRGLWCACDGNDPVARCERRSYRYGRDGVAGDLDY